jgi:hypothetical protein
VTADHHHRPSPWYGAIALAAVLAACSGPAGVDTAAPTVVATTLTTSSFTLTGPGVTTGAVASAIAAVDLGSAGGFVLLAKTGISAETSPAITGDVGISPAALSYVTGSDETLDASETFATSALVNGTIYAANLASSTPTTLTTAISAMETAYTDAAGRTTPNETELATGLIGGLVIAHRLYTWGTEVARSTPT